MSKLTYYIAGICATLLIVLGIIFSPKAPEKVINTGSVENGSGYSSLTVKQSNGSTTAAVAVVGGSHVLGSVVISSTTPYAVSIYDGLASTTGAATLIATFPVSATVGTYTFDVSVTRGITVGGIAGFNGSYIVTYR